MAGTCANDFLSVPVWLERWRRREGSACVSFLGCEWGRQEEAGGRREQPAFPVLVSGVADGKLVVES